MHTHTPQNSATMLPVYALAFAAFVFNTSEFLPIALLSDIGASFKMTADETGVMMTIYAWVVAVCSLPMMLLTAKIERKKLLLLVFLLFIIAHGFSFVATSFWFLVGSRILVALAHAIFWSITASLAVRVAPQGKESKAIGFLATGGAVATILGLPLGRIVGQMSDWQTAFLGIGLLAVVLSLVVQKLLPTLPATDTGDIKSLPKIIKNTPLIIRYLLILLVVTAHFTAYSYVEPFVLKAGFSPNLATAVLLLFGASGIISSFIFGRFYDRLENRLIWVAFGVMLVGLLLLSVATAYPMLWFVIAMAWGASANILALSLQMQVLKQAENDKDVAMSLFSGIFNVGIGGGALVGGLVVAYLGLSAIGFVGALVLAVAIVVFGLKGKNTNP